MNVEVFHSELTRRNFLRSAPAAAAALLAAGALPARAAEGERFSFFQINDLHYSAPDCGRWFRAVVEQMKASAPEAQLCLLCGDLADKGEESALRAVKEIFTELGIPLLPTPGNHDFTADESRAAYDAVFPGTLNYRRDHKGWQFIGIDSTMGTKYDKTAVADATLAWLDSELPKLDATKPTVAFTHFPLGEDVTYRPVNAGVVVERLLKLNLVAAFSGHWHGASERTAKNATLTTSRCCARVRNNADRSPLKGWFVCEAQPGGSLTRRFVEFAAPAGIPTPDITAPKSKGN